MQFNMYLSPQNICIVIVLLLPNVLTIFLPPIDMPKIDRRPANWFIIILLERIGQIGIFVLPFFLKLSIDTDIKRYVLAASIILIIMYYICWVRFFFSGRLYHLFYKDLLFIPIPMAILPILYCLGISILLNSWVYGIITFIFALGHISESLFIRNNIV